MRWVKKGLVMGMVYTQIYAEDYSERLCLFRRWRDIGSMAIYYLHIQYYTKLYYTTLLYGKLYVHHL
jgi:hypothetical protein